ncbi:MAG TPA: ribonuclease J [Polyangiaceae bacterium]|nr:ribonuclease J [Polyangiaceae bacterium]
MQVSSIPEQQIRIVPLGGLGEIGMNCFALEQAGGIVVVDCGAAFADDDVGIDVWHPDFSWLLAHKERVRGVFITHGHEDHVGALPYLLSDLDVPVWGPPHALGIAKRRLAEHDFAPNELDFREAHAGRAYEVGPFTIEPVRVAHSIIEASALHIRTAVGSILHTGDFNFDPDPPDGEPTDEARLTALGDQGISLLLSDSTNIDVPVRAGSERAVGQALEELVREAPARVVIAMFASNIQRLILLGEIARRTNRKLCLFGRSLETQYAVASQIGRLSWPSDLVVSGDQAAQLPRERLLVLAGGTQAERNSALKRLSLGAHPLLKLGEGDTVIFSSRIIPGNDRPVFAMMNDLLRAGVILKTRFSDPSVHTSGHAGRSEQSRMIELCRPNCFLPVHGTLHHLQRHEELARELGVSETIVVENGTPVVCDGHKLWKDSTVPHGRVAIAMGGEALSSDTHQRRLELGRLGIAFVTLALGRNDKLVAPVAVRTRGVPLVDNDEVALRAVARELTRSVESFHGGRSLNLAEFVRRAARRKLEELSGTRPIVEVETLELE